MKNEKFQNKGKIWANTYKQKPNQPDWKGKGNFNGVEFEMAMWFNAPQNDEENGTFTVSFQEPKQKEQQPAKQQFNARNFATNEANKMFSRDIAQSYEPEEDDLIF